MMLKHFIHKTTSCFVKNSIRPINGMLRINHLNHFGTSAQYINQKYMNQAEFLTRPDGQQLRIKPNSSDFKFSREIPDFDVGARTPKKQIEITKEMSKEKHPLEYITEHMRKHENPFLSMNDRCVMLTNFPKDLIVSQEYVLRTILEADPQANVKRIQIQEAMQGVESSQPRAAYAIVEFDRESTIKNVYRELRKKWLKDCLMKVRTLQDVEQESFNDRTIIVQNIKQHWSTSEIVEQFGQFGAVTHIELPTVDAMIKAQMQEKGLFNDHYTRQSKKKHEQEYRYSQAVLKDTLQQDQEFEELLNQTIGEDQAAKMKNTNYTNFEMLDQERIESFTRVIQSLKIEGVQLENSKSTIKSLVNEFNSMSQSGLNQESTSEIKNSIESSKDKLVSTMKYLLNNQESLDEAQQRFITRLTKEQGQDPVYELQRMSMAELTSAYDFMLSILQQREKLIKTRIKDSMRFHQKEERVLFETKDFSKENESMPDILANILLYDDFAIDRILGVDEQISSIDHLRNMQPEEKMYCWMTNTFDFLDTPTFNETSLNTAKTDQYDHVRDLDFQTDNKTRSQIREQAPYLPWIEDARELIFDNLERAEKEFQTPFDQLYHKERKLVQDIIRIETIIKKLTEELPDPAELMRYDPAMIDDDEKYGNLYSDLEPQYLRDQREKERLRNNRNKSSLFDESEDARHSYNEQQIQTIEDLIASGQVNKREYEMAKSMKLQNAHINLGYALVTFSHAQEARKAILLTDGEYIAEDTFLDVMMKDRLDHSELDRSYFMRKITNEGKIVDHQKELREASQSLRDFERNINDEIPTLSKLKDFKSIAQEIIENKKGKTRRHRSTRRDQREIEELYMQLKDFQASNPTMDVSSLFENYEADRARLQQHKQALQSYKKFEFLKAGVQQKPVKNTTKQSEVYEPYNYPGLTDSVSKVFVDGSQLKIADAGENTSANSYRQRRGRRFSKYNRQEFLEAYLGKDYARRPNLDHDPYNELFGYQDTIKELFPDFKEYLMYPNIKREKDQFKELMGVYRQDGEAIDPKMAEFVKTVDKQKFLDDHTGEHVTVHPTDKTRTFQTDMQAKLKEMQSRKRKNQKVFPYQKELTLYMRELSEEYDIDAYPQMDDEDALEAWVDNIESTMNNRDDKLQSEFDEIAEELSDQKIDAVREQMQNAFQDTFDDHTQVTEAVPNYVSESDGEEFEKDSNYNPEQRDGENPEQDQVHVKKKRVVREKRPERTYKYVQDPKPAPPHDLDFETPTTNFGSKQKQRMSNENLLNLQHQARQNKLDTTTSTFHEYKNMARTITEARLNAFNTVKAEQEALPVRDRVPHYLNENGLPRPYSLTQLSNMHEDEVINVLKHQDHEVVKECTIDELLTIFKKHAYVEPSLNSGVGQMFKYQQTEMDQEDLAMHDFRKGDGDRTLQDFYTEDKSTDIYEEYMKADDKLENIRRQTSAQIQRERELNDVVNEADQKRMKAPQFDEYVQKEAQAKDIFDSYSGVDNEEREQQEEMQRIQEEQENDYKYRRELVARLFGGSLTGRQFAIIFNMQDSNADVDESVKRAMEFKNQRKAKNDIKVAEEILESFRRNKVVKGLWAEQESHSKLQDMLTKINERFPTDTSFKIHKREERKRLSQIFELGIGSQMKEREYYFDEGLGQTLREHITQLQGQLKHSEIETRRDGDNLAIVKISYKPNFKYNLDKIMATDPEEINRISKETTEALMKNQGASSDPRSILDSMNGQVPDDQIIDTNKKELLNQLFEERFHGKYKNDIDGFVTEFNSIRSMMNTSEPATMEGATGMNAFTVDGRAAIQDTAYAMIQKDLSLFSMELTQQIKMKLSDKVYREKREMQDMVKPARSENLLYREQATSLQNTMDLIERDNEWLLNAGDNDKIKENEWQNLDEYKKLKAQIKQAKETKERMIQSGFPEFKPYKVF